MKKCPTYTFVRSKTLIVDLKVLILAKSSARLRNASDLHWFVWLVFFYSTSFWWPWIKYYYFLKYSKGKKLKEKLLTFDIVKIIINLDWKTINDRKSNLRTNYYTRTSVQSLYSLMRQGPISGLRTLNEMVASQTTLWYGSQKRPKIP